MNPQGENQKLCRDDESDPSLGFIVAGQGSCGENPPGGVFACAGGNEDDELGPDGGSHPFD